MKDKRAKISTYILLKVKEIDWGLVLLLLVVLVVFVVLAKMGFYLGGQ